VAAKDIHLATAVSLGWVPPGGDADTYKAERNRAKPLTHGTNYGISAIGIKRRLGIPMRQAMSI
jgi:DNA polymerase I-like protein with 3'-5' exonuclease and polymerase domains